MFTEIEEMNYYKEFNCIIDRIYEYIVPKINCMIQNLKVMENKTTITSKSVFLHNCGYDEEICAIDVIKDMQTCASLVLNAITILHSFTYVVKKNTQDSLKSNLYTIGLYDICNFSKYASY